MLERISEFRLPSPLRLGVTTAAMAFMAIMIPQLARRVAVATIAWHECAHRVAHAHHHVDVSPGSVSVIDIAPGVPASEYPALLHFGPYEHVFAVDDQPVRGADLEAGILLAHAAAAGGHRYIDLAIGAPGETRRVLMLVH